MAAFKRIQQAGERLPQKMRNLQERMTRGWDSAVHLSGVEMSKRALDLLLDLDLIGRDGCVADLSAFSDTDLTGKLDTYAQVRIEALDNEVQRAASTASKFSALVSSISARNAVLDLVPESWPLDIATFDMIRL